MHLLFLCVANSARSQIAEGLARTMVPRSWTVQSAGSAPTSVRPQAITVMAECGIDITAHSSKHMDSITQPVDCIITLCAEEACPTALQDVRRLHWPIEDPAGFDMESEDEQLMRFRIARERIRERLDVFIDAESVGPDKPRSPINT